MHRAVARGRFYTQNYFNRVTSLTKSIQLTYRKLYTLGIYLIVNKTIKRFIRRALEIINIPSKLILKGFKIQVLANKGYIINQLQHIRDNNRDLVNLNKYFTKEEGFLKIQVVILDLLT